MSDVRTAGRPASQQRESPAWLEVVRAHNEPKLRVLSSQIRYAERFVELSAGYVRSLLARRVSRKKVENAVAVVRADERVLTTLRQARERLASEVRGVLYNPERVTQPPANENAERLVARTERMAEERARKRLRDRQLARNVVPRKFVDVTRVVHKDGKIHFYWPEDHPLHGHAVYERKSDGTCGKQLYFRAFGIKRPMKEVARRVHEERLLDFARRRVLPAFQYGAYPTRIVVGDVSIRARYAGGDRMVITVRDGNLSDVLRFVLLKDGEARDIEWR